MPTRTRAARIPRGPGTRPGRWRAVVVRWRAPMATVDIHEGCLRHRQVAVAIWCRPSRRARHGSSPAAPDPPRNIRGRMGARAVVERYLDAMARGDLGALAACVSDDVLLLRPDATIRGGAAVIDECRELLGGAFAPGTYTRHNDVLGATDDLALLVWRAECLGTEITHGVTTFLVRADRIVRVTSVAEFRPV